ncbi:MAG: hypothetical protein AB4057_23545 [Crocosphaera sp.]
MIDDLEPKEFCRKWVPKIYGIQPGTKGKRGYRKASLELLSYVCDAPKSTCAGWIDYDSEDPQRRPNRYLSKYLRMVDLKLTELELIPQVFLSFSKNLRAKSEIIDN